MRSLSEEVGVGERDLRLHLPGLTAFIVFPPEERRLEAGVPVVHDAVAVVRRVQRELERVPGVVNPLVRQHIEVVHPDVSVPVRPGVGVQEAHVVQQLVGDDTHRVRVCGVEAGQDPQSAGEAGQRSGSDVGVGSVEGAVTGAAGTVPAHRNSSGSEWRNNCRLYLAM